MLAVIRCSLPCSLTACSRLSPLPEPAGECAARGAALQIPGFRAGKPASRGPAACWPAPVGQPGKSQPNLPGSPGQTMLR